MPELVSLCFSLSLLLAMNRFLLSDLAGTLVPNPTFWSRGGLVNVPARSLSTNQFLANSKEREKQHETSSAIGGEIIMEDEGYPTVQNPYSTKPKDFPYILPLISTSVSKMDGLAGIVNIFLPVN